MTWILRLLGLRHLARVPEDEDQALFEARGAGIVRGDDIDTGVIGISTHPSDTISASRISAGSILVRCGTVRR